MLNDDEVNDRALVVAMPLRHLEAARTECERTGSSTLPAGGPGDLDAAPPGTTVLVIATDAGDAEVAAATWRGVFEARVAHEPGDPWPSGLPVTWVEERSELERRIPNDGAHVALGDEEDEDEDEEGVGPQSFFRVRELAPSPRGAWIHANELVPKQQRGGRTFLPHTPRLVRFID
jgi:hypothetical protein